MRSKSTDTSTPERAWLHALKLLAARDYTAARLRGKLTASGFSADDANAAISRLESERFINDNRFAERFAESAIAGGRFFGARLNMELRRRGVPASVVNDVLAQVSEEHDEEDEVRAVLERRFPDFSGPAITDRDKRRVIGFLQRRGFGISAILRVIRTHEPADN